MGHSTVASYRPTKISADGAHPAPRALPQPSWLLLIITTATVAGLVWGLMQQRRPEIDPRQIIAINLAAGELAFKHARYLEPAEHSAVHYFNAVLALEPTHPRALRGLHHISEYFAEQAKNAILDSRFADAAVAIERLRRLQTDDRRLGLLEIELRKALDVHVTMLAAIAAKAPEASADSAAGSAQSAVDVKIDAKRSDARGVQPRKQDFIEPEFSGSSHSGSSGSKSRLSTPNLSTPSLSTSSVIESSQAVAAQRAAASRAISAPITASTVPSVERSDQAAKQAVAPLTARIDEARVDQPRIPASGATPSMPAQSPLSIEQPTPADTTLMAAVTRPAAPIEVSARWLPTAVKLVEPHYPQAAQVRGIEGWVDLMLTVAPTGEVIDAQVRDREGSRSFERAALLAVRQWRYEPNAAGSTAPALEIPVRVGFKLE